MPSPSGFFAGSVAVGRAPTPLLPQCGACGLYKSCRSPKMPVTGKGRKGILVIAEAPGKTEDEEGIQLVGEAGQLLRRELDRVGIDLDLDCWKTNAIICRPENNRTPTAEEIAYCRPNVVKTIKDLQPTKILLLGGVAVRSVIGWLWKLGIGALEPWVGWQIPSCKINAWVCPTYHPSYLLHKAETDEGKVASLWFRRHLDAFAALPDSRPWEEVPDYSSKVEAIFNDQEAAAIVRQIASKSGPVVIDFETNRIKPDPDNAKIYCCGLSYAGQKTIAFPWRGEAVKAAEELFASPQPKIAANMKFEERWSIKEFGVGIRNWVWDTMQAAHILDNRREITSVKFQSFVLLGQDSYNDHIDPYLESEDSNGLNRIKEIDPLHLLKYCGMDALLEWKIAEKQWEAFGWRPI